MREANVLGDNCRKSCVDHKRSRRLWLKKKRKILTETELTRRNVQLQANITQDVVYTWERRASQKNYVNEFDRTYKRL